MAVLVAGLLLSVFVHQSLIVSVSCLAEDFILAVVPHCGDDPLVDGWIEVTSDLSISATARCDNGIQQFAVEDAAHCTMDVSFARNGTAQCLMTKRIGATVYSTIVYVGWGENLSPLITSEEQFIVTCSFGEKGSKESVERTGVDALVAPTELQNHHGSAVSSDIQLQVTDVLKVPVVVALATGRRIQLIATTNGNEGELGIRPSSCDAIGTNINARYAILRAGCGDGIIFEKDEGFISDGLSSISPYFRAFQVTDDSNIRFECNFTVCSAACDGSSCTNERKRNIHTQEMETFVGIYTPIYKVQSKRNLLSKGYSDDQPSSEQTLSLGINLLFSVLSILCILSLSLSLYNYILVNQVS